MHRVPARKISKVRAFVVGEKAHFTLQKKPFFTVVLSQDQKGVNFPERNVDGSYHVLKVHFCQRRLFLKIVGCRQFNVAGNQCFQLFPFLLGLEKVLLPCKFHLNANIN